MIYRYVDWHYCKLSSVLTDNFKRDEKLSDKNDYRICSNKIFVVCGDDVFICQLFQFIWNLRLCELYKRHRDHSTNSYHIWMRAIAYTIFLWQSEPAFETQPWFSIQLLFNMMLICSFSASLDNIIFPEYVNICIEKEF